MAQWTLDNKIVDGYWQGYDHEHAMFAEPMGCNREELFSLFVGHAGWRVFKNQDSAGVSVLVCDERPGMLLVVWKIPGMALTNGQARRILAEWHGGQASAVYSVMSSGNMGRRGEAVEELRADRQLVRNSDNGDYPDNADRELSAVILWLECQQRAMPSDEWVNAWDETPA